MTIINIIKEYWALITFLAGVLIALATFIFYIIQAVKCSLRNDILSIYDRAKDRGKKITLYELDAISHSSEVYFKLKGNSFVKNVIEEIKDFDKID